MFVALASRCSAGEWSGLRVRCAGRTIPQSHVYTPSARHCPHVQIIVSAEGDVGLVMEHAPVDGTVVVPIMDYCYTYMYVYSPRPSCDRSSHERAPTGPRNLTAGIRLVHVASTCQSIDRSIS